MKGVAVILNNTGEPSVLTIDLKASPPMIRPMVEALLKAINEDDDRSVFLQDSSRQFERAYGPNEPEYTEADLRKK